MNYTYETFPQYEFHSIANNFPMASYEEHDLLKNDILDKKRVINPIVLYDDKILDGRNRYEALKQIFEQDEIEVARDGKTPLEIEVSFEDYDKEKKKPIDEVKMYADSLNLVRRHLTASQKAGLSLVLYRDKFNKIAEEKKDNETGGIKLVGKERSSAAEAFGNLVGVNATYIKKALNVVGADAKVGEKILKYVYEGYLNINQAAALMKLENIDERNKAISELDKAVKKVKEGIRRGSDRGENRAVRKDKLTVGSETIKPYISKEVNKKKFTTDDSNRIALYIPFEVSEKVISKLADVLYQNIFFKEIGDEQKFNIAVIKPEKAEGFDEFKDKLDAKEYDGLTIKDKYSIEETSGNGETIRS